MASFIPYNVVPGRTPEWYERECNLSMEMDGTLDYVFETYPKSPKEATLPKSVNKRFLVKWLDRCYEERAPLLEMTPLGVTGDKEAIEEFDKLGELLPLPFIPGVRIYELPQKGKTYIVTADPGEGLTASDDSALSVFDDSDMTQVLAFNESVEPALFASYIDIIGRFYNGGAVLYELNEHGRAVDLWMHDNSDLKLLKGWAATESSRKAGWTQNSASKPLAFHNAVDYLKEGRCKFYDEATYLQLSVIEAGTNKAPPGLKDDLSMSFVLGLAAKEFCHTKLMFGTIKITH